VNTYGEEDEEIKGHEEEITHFFGLRDFTW